MFVSCFFAKNLAKKNLPEKKVFYCRTNKQHFILDFFDRRILVHFHISKISSCFILTFFFFEKKTLLVCPWRIYELRDVGSIKERSSQKGAWFLEGVHVQLTDPLCDNITVLEILKVVVLKFTRRFSNNIFDYYILRGNKLPTLLHFDLNYLRK